MDRNKSKKRLAQPAVARKPTAAPVPVGAVRAKSLPVPRGLPDAGNSDDRLCWRFRHADHDSRWCIHQAADDLCSILGQLANLESMTVGEAFPGGGYPGKEYEVESIPTREALDRLEAIGLADMTKISVLRLGGMPRLYGFRDKNIFHVVWWDPQHEIWPSRKKHT
jgi:hypothetical protein